MVRELDFSDGFETATPPTMTAVTITGTSAAPVLITAGGGITADDVTEEDQYVAGDGGAVDVSANPQVSPGTYHGQKLNLIGTSDTDTVTLENGDGLELNGECVLTQGAILALRWNATSSLWTERYRNGMA